MSIRLAILTVSDTGAAGRRRDASGPAVERALKAIDARVVVRRIVPDDRAVIRHALRACVAQADLVVTTGGTGLSPRDVTPDATRDVIDREVPGLAEAMRAEGLRHTPRAALSRAVVGTVGTSLIVNLPGSPRGVTENLAAIIDAIPHALETLRGVGECARPDDPERAGAPHA